MEKSKDRCSYNDEYKWDTCALYETEDDFKKELDNIKGLIKGANKYQGKLFDSDNLYNFLIYNNEVSRKISRAYIYAHINNDADTRDAHYQELFGLIANINEEYEIATSYVLPELMSHDYKEVEEKIKKDNRLQEFERYLKQTYRNKVYVLSKEQEEILSYFSKILGMPEDIESVLTDSDLKFDSIMVDGKEIELTESNYQVYIKHPNREVRKSAFLSLYKGYKSFNNTLANILKYEVDINNANAKVRGYKDALNSSLYHNEISDKVYYNLIEAVHKNLSSLYNYFDFKKKMLKLDDLHLYDTSVMLNENEEREYSFEEAKDIISESLKPLGHEYVNDLHQAFTDGWIDSVNNTGKRGGAYSTDCYDVHPYVLLSYEGKLENVSTLAHELGHAMHSYYASKTQKYQDAGYSIFVAEVASQVNELLLYFYLLDKTEDKKVKVKLMDSILSKFKSTIYRQTMFAEFELYIHEYASKGGIINYDMLNDKYYELNKLYFGDNVFVDDEIKYEWSRIPHFYYFFYVYQYATGFAASVKIAREIYNGNEEMRNNYLKFLTLGRTLSPIESLKVVGLDMESTEVVDDAIKYMDELLNKIKQVEDVK